MLVASIGIDAAASASATSIPSEVEDRTNSRPVVSSAIKVVRMLDDQGVANRAPAQDVDLREHHLAGPLGVQLMALLCAKGWLRRSKSSRAVEVTPNGWAGLKKEFGIQAPLWPRSASRRPRLTSVLESVALVI